MPPREESHVHANRRQPLAHLESVPYLGWTAKMRMRNGPRIRLAGLGFAEERASDRGELASIDTGSDIRCEEQDCNREIRPLIRVGVVPRQVDLDVAGPRNKENIVYGHRLAAAQLRESLGYRCRI